MININYVMKHALNVQDHMNLIVLNVIIQKVIISRKMMKFQNAI